MPADFAAIIQRAVDLVCDDPSIQILEQLRPRKDGSIGDFEFFCSLPVDPHPNPENLPATVKVRVCLDRAFPRTPITIYACDPHVQGFPHQDAETGKLCLRQASEAPLDARRLKVYLDWAKEWLHDAASGSLLVHGDRYELPDFSRKILGDKIPIKVPLFIAETGETLLTWKPFIGRTGPVRIVATKRLRGMLAQRFRTDGGETILETSCPDILNDPNRCLWGRWILLPSFNCVRHRPPQTIGELRTLCRASGVDFLGEVKKAWKEGSKDPAVTALLVGAPIPVRLGSEPVEIHWQPLWFQGQHVDSLVPRQPHGRVKPRTLWNTLENEGAFGDKQPLPWGETSSVTAGRVFARGQHVAISNLVPVVIAGCGALGSVVAELITRGGAEDVTLIDPDPFDVGNQCRHTLDGRAVGECKAIALAERLQSCFPLSKIRGSSHRLPLIQGRDAETDGLFKQLERSQLLLDCTTDEGAFSWLSDFARSRGIPLASLFLNFRATVLTVVVSGRHTACRKVCQKLYADIETGTTPVSQEEHAGAINPDDRVVPGAGCWHPTFPATNSQVWMLACAGVECLKEILGRPWRTDGTAVLIKRHEVSPGASSVPLIDIAWRKEYR